MLRIRRNMTPRERYVFDWGCSGEGDTRLCHCAYCGKVLEVCNEVYRGKVIEVCIHCGMEHDEYPQPYEYETFPEEEEEDEADGR